MAIDKVTLGILGNHCAAAAESMAFTLYRTAHSTFVKETEDFTTGLTTPDGQTFATPTDLGATWFVGLNYGNVIRAFDEYHDGDICMTNDPYSGYVCTHPPDMHLWKPIFHEGEIVCFAVGHVHNTDVGGAVPASLSRSLTEVHQEGIRIPPTKLYSAGVLNQPILDVIRTNVRVPDQNWGDLKAQVAAMNTGERKVKEMIERFGIETFREGMFDLMDYAEAQTRELVRSLPDGVYRFSDYLDEDSVGGYPCRIALKLTIEGDSIEFDFTGSDPQLESSINMPTGGDPRHILMMVGLDYVLYSLDPSIVLNSGMTRVCHCILPQGTIVNPEFPAAVGMRSLTEARLMDVIFGAFAQVVPDRLAACSASGGPIMNVNSVDHRTGRRVVASIGPISGGAGGNPREDGTDGSGGNSSFLKNTPVEINEAEVPIHILRYGLTKDSAGAGRYRGGLATELEFRVYAPNTRITARNRDRNRFRAWGTNGGRAGGPSSFLLNPGSEREVNLGNTDILTVAPGDVIKVACGGAAGWGPPWERPAQDVLMDVRRGFVSPERAEQDYGVVLTKGAIDEAATVRRRAALKAQGRDAFFDFGPEREAFDAVWTEANYDVLTVGLAALPTHWRFFIKQRVFETVASVERIAGDGSELKRIMGDIVAEYPQLASGNEAAAARGA
jgi:N-methylhydantoinase B